MTGIRFKDWETFLRYVGSQEKMKHKEEWRKAVELWDMDDLEPGEWKGMEKILSPSNYEELAMRLGTVEVRSFRLPFESDGMIFYAAGKEEGKVFSFSSLELNLWKKMKRTLQKAVMFRYLSGRKEKRPAFIRLEQSRSIGVIMRSCQKEFQAKYWRRCF